MSSNLAKTQHPSSNLQLPLSFRYSSPFHTYKMDIKTLRLTPTPLSLVTLFPIFISKQYTIIVIYFIYLCFSLPTSPL